MMLLWHFSFAQQSLSDLLYNYISTGVIFLVALWLCSEFLLDSRVGLIKVILSSGILFFDPLKWTEPHFSFDLVNVRRPCRHLPCTSIRFSIMSVYFLFGLKICSSMLYFDPTPIPHFRSLPILCPTVLNSKNDFMNLISIVFAISIWLWYFALCP